MEITDKTFLEIVKSINNLAESIKTGIPPAAGSGKKNDITLSNYSKEYSELVKYRLSREYVRSIELSFRHLTGFLGENKSLSAVTVKDIERFIIHLQQSAPEGYRVYFRSLKTGFNKAVDWEYITDNPFNKVRLEKKQIMKPDHISKPELIKINDLVINPVVSNIISFGFYTGMRLNEILNLTWNNVDLVNRSIQIGDSEYKTKTRKARVIPICNEVYNLLVSIYPKIFVYSKPYVFGKDLKTRFSANYISKKFKEACRKAGLSEKIHFHSLRHSAASYLVNKGANINVIQELLGHTSINTTMIYTHVDLTAMREAVSLFDYDIEIRDKKEASND